MQAAQKLLICLVCDKFDGFEGAMSKVRIKLSPHFDYFQRLFSNVTAEEIVNNLLRIDLTSSVNKKLKKMVNDDTDNDIVIENQLYAMIKRLMANKVTKQVVTLKFSPIEMSGWGRGQMEYLFSCGVNINGTRDGLISELNDKLKVWHLNFFTFNSKPRLCMAWQPS